MDPKRLSKIERLLYRAVLVTWIVSAALMLFLLNKIDMIVNTELYNFGLQLSAEWLLPYWTYIRLNYALLGLPIALSLLALSIGFIRKNEGVAENVTKQRPKPQPTISQGSLLRKENNKSPEAASTSLISCSACKKEFSRPLVSLSFAAGKTRLVNVCPYCNHTLGAED
jgi:DNA-directed RNA polymerase subunit RPC12/RpoP